MGSFTKLDVSCRDWQPDCCVESLLFLLLKLDKLLLKLDKFHALWTLAPSP